MIDDESNGGQGADARLSRSEMADVRRACRQDWPIGHDVQARVLQQLVNLIDPEYVHADGRRPSHRTRISAARTLGALASLSLRQQALDIVRDKASGRTGEKTLADLVAEAEAVELEFDRERERGGGAEAGPAAGPVP